MEYAVPFPSLSMENQIKCYLLATDDKVEVGSCGQARIQCSEALSFALKHSNLVCGLEFFIRDLKKFGKDQYRSCTKF